MLEADLSVTPDLRVRVAFFAPGAGATRVGTGGGPVRDGIVATYGCQCVSEEHAASMRAEMERACGLLGITVRA